MDELVRGERMETKALDELIEYTKSFDDYATSGLGDKASAELASLKARLAEADENLLSMVNQYCAKTVRPDGTPETYSHDFMSTGEAAFEYLVEKGLAKWCENGVDIYDLKFQESEAKP
jgi:hypothetical protein